MQFISLKIQNFGSIKSAELSLESRGLTLVSGSNEDANNADSNGSGKSFLLDAICWAVWGETVRGLKGDDVIHNQVGKNCKVEVHLQDQGTKYRICRYRKHNKSRKPNDLELWINDVEDSGSTMSITQQKIATVVGLDFFTFRAMMPGAGVALSQLADADVKALFEKLLQTDILTEAYARSRTLYRETQRTFDAQVAALVAQRTKIGDLETRLAMYSVKQAEFEQDKIKQCAAVSARINGVEGKVHAQESENVRISNLVVDEKELNTQLKALSKAVLEAQATLTKTQDRMHATNTVLCSKVAVADSACTAARDSVFEFSDFAKLSTCSVCKQEVSEEHKIGVEKTLALAFSMAEEAKYAAKQELSTSIAALEEELSACQQALSLVTSEFLAKQEEKKSVELMHAKVAASKELLETLNKQLEVEREALVTWEASTSPFTDLVSLCIATLDDEYIALGSLEELETSLKQQLKDQEFWVRGFSPKGVRSFMLEHIVPYLNSRAFHYCGLLTAHDLSIAFDTKTTLKSSKIKDAFRIVVDMKQGTSTYEGASEGEKARINLILALVLGDLASVRSKKKLTFRFLDEPFEKMDELGTESVVSLLNAHKDEYDTTFVVTHKSHFKSLFNDVITVVKRNGVSQILEQ